QSFSPTGVIGCLVGPPFASTQYEPQIERFRAQLHPLFFKEGKRVEWLGRIHRFACYNGTALKRIGRLQGVIELEKLLPSMPSSPWKSRFRSLFSRNASQERTPLFPSRDRAEPKA